MPEIIFSGPEGRLEGRYHQAEEKNAPIALVLHPHPLYGGTMNNKIAYQLFHSFVRAGFSVLRFNFRGVGRSQGKFDDGIGELADAATALDWLQIQNPEAFTCWISGFSFGAWIAMQLLMRRPEVEGFINVSPPANMYDFGFLSPCPAHGLIMQGDKDEIVAEDSVASLVEKLQAQKGMEARYEVVQGADHYYRNTQEEMVKLFDEYIDETMKIIRAKPRIKPDRKRRHLTAEILQSMMSDEAPQ